MDSDIRERLASATKKLGGSVSGQSISTSSAPTPTAAKLDHPKPKKPTRKIRRPKKNTLLSTLAVILLLAVGVTAYFLFIRSSDEKAIVPVSIRKSVSFPVYYPDPTKLPAGYTLDQNSFSASGQAVVYSVSYTGDKKIAFTVQKKPSDSEIKTFYANQLPLKNEVTTPVGTAVMGVLNDRTFVSLPTQSDSWLIVTAPVDTDQGKLTDVLRTLVKPLDTK